jgi:polyphosphate kinase
MPRNLDRRIEVLVPIDEAEHRARLNAVIDSDLDPATAAWLLAPDGTWSKVGTADSQLSQHRSALERAQA